MTRIYLLCMVLLPLGLPPEALSQGAGLPDHLTWDADLVNIESVEATGSGVYIAVVDTGLAPNWADYLPRDNVATHLGTGFEQPVHFRSSAVFPCGWFVESGRIRQSTWVGSVESTHGTHVISTILGYAYRDNADALAGFDLPPIRVRGLAPGVTVIPVKVFGQFQYPARPGCGEDAQMALFGTEQTIAAGIEYVTGLAQAGYLPMVMNLSFGGSALGSALKDAIDRAIAAGVIVVAAAGNLGERGMTYPGAYAPVISVGAAGWTGEWLVPGGGQPWYRMWWLQDRDPGSVLLADSGQVADPTSAGDVYVADFSSRAVGGQQLDLLAPGSWVRGPYPGSPGYSHLPWWSRGTADLASRNPGNFYYVSGTSMATPHVSSVVALMLQKNPMLTQSAAEAILKETALILPADGQRQVYDISTSAWNVVRWSAICGVGRPCDPVGAGLVQADRAVNVASAGQ